MEVPDVKPTGNTIFRNIQAQNAGSSSKTGKIIMESVIHNCGDIPELPGTRIVCIEYFNDQYYLVSDKGIYAYDANFIFPKKLFEPDRSMVSDKLQYEDQRAADKRIQLAMNLLR